MALTLPSWFTPANARTIALVVLVLSLVMTFLVLRFVQQMMMKLGLTLAMLLIAFIAWHERADLQNCAKTCECRMLVFDVKIPSDKLPDNSSVVCGDRAPS